MSIFGILCIGLNAKLSALPLQCDRVNPKLADIVTIVMPHPPDLFTIEMNDKIVRSSRLIALKRHMQSAPKRNHL